MAYTKTAWVNDSLPAVNATNLNKIEQGIYDAHAAIAAIPSPAVVKLAEVTLTAVAATLIFTPPASGYKHLEFVFSGNKQTYASAWISFRVNGLSSTIYDQQYQLGQGGTNTSGESGSQTTGICSFGYGTSSTDLATAVNRQSFRMTIFDYLSTKASKSAKSDFTADWGGGTNGAGGRYVGDCGTLIRLASAINNVTFYTDSNFEIGTYCAMYGIV